MRTGERTSSTDTEGGGGRRKAPGGEGRLQGRALAARDPRVPNRSQRSNRCHEMNGLSVLPRMTKIAQVGSSERLLGKLLTASRGCSVTFGSYDNRCRDGGER
jgi:hypothetical protein